MQLLDLYSDQLRIFRIIYDFRVFLKKCIIDVYSSSVLSIFFHTQRVSVTLAITMTVSVVVVVVVVGVNFFSFSTSLKPLDGFASNFV